MDLVYDDPPDRAEMFFHPLPDQNGLESLRRCDHNVRGALCLSRSRADWGVFVSDLDFDVKILSHLLKSAEKISVESPERGHVEDGDSPRLSFRSGFDEPIKHGEDGGKGLPGTGWSDQQNVFAA